MNSIELATSFLSKDADLQRIATLVRRIAPTDEPVLVQGEPGTGKQLLAQTIHALSPRADAFAVWIFRDKLADSPDYFATFPEELLGVLQTEVLSENGKTTVILEGRENLYAVRVP